MASEQDQSGAPQDHNALVESRREKLRRFREELGINPFGQRVDGLIPLAQARAMFDRAAHEAHSESSAKHKSDPSVHVFDDRPHALVAGRCVQHREMGKLAFIVLRDSTGDLQISVSKSAVSPEAFKVATKLDYGDIVVAGGPVGATQKGEICIWADRFELHCKSLEPPPEKFHGLTDPELRYRRRYVDMYVNPETTQTFIARSQLLARLREFMAERGFLEVETPMMQPIAGGAAARPFVTHHNALDMKLFLRIAPELYLKRLLVGGLPRVYEVSRNFRNEGVDRSHNPEFTAMEVYEAFGNCWSMLDLTEALLVELAEYSGQLRTEARSDEPAEEDRGQHGTTLPYGDIAIDWSRPFERVTYGEIFERTLGVPMTDESQVRSLAKQMNLEKSDMRNHWLLVEELFERKCEDALDPARPTFITDYPSAVSPLTRPQHDKPHLAERWELIVAGMELGTAYTELNDPDLQRRRFTEQIAGLEEDDEAAAIRTLDEDFLLALRVGMPPAGGLGLGIDRIIMLLTDSRSIRDVILFPLMKPE
jgi:lysyl-tRNA synthetase class 2